MSEFNLDYYISALQDTLQRSSRTSSTGKIDATVSGATDKPKSILNDSDELKRKSFENAISCVRILHDSTQPYTPESLRRVVEGIALEINKDLIEERLSPFRTHEIKNPSYGCAVSEIEEQMNLFYGWAAEIYNADLDFERVVEYSALIEKIIDKNIHPLGDGCGRFAKLLSAHLSMRNRMPLKVFPDRKSHYDAMDEKRLGEDMFNLEKERGIIELYKRQPIFEKS